MSAPMPIQWLRDHRDGLKLGDASVKFASYVGRLGLLVEFPLVGRLKPLSNLRDVFWGLSAIRDLYEAPAWYREWMDQGEDCTWINRVHLLTIRVNFVTKTTLRAAKLVYCHPLIVKAKAALSNTALVLILSMDAKLLGQVLWARVRPRKEKEETKSITLQAGLGMGDDFLDLINTGMDLGFLSDSPYGDVIYVATGLGSATLSVTKASRKIWNK